MAEMPDMSSRDVSEPWLAFELLMAWADAIVRLRPRLETTLSRLTRRSRARSADELRVEVTSGGLRAIPSTPSVICSSTPLGSSLNIISGSEGLVSSAL